MRGDGGANSFVGGVGNDTLDGGSDKDVFISTTRAPPTLSYTDFLIW